MPKGDVRKFEFKELIDSKTGSRVTRITPLDSINFRNYFYQKCFTGDSEHLLFGSAFDGSSNIWLVDLRSGQARQVTEGKGSTPHGAWISPDDKFIYYVRQNRDLRRVDIETLQEEVIYSVPEGWRGAGTWVANSACTKVAAIEQLDADVIKDCTGWEKFRKQYDNPPKSRLLSIDLGSGVSKVVFEDNRFIGHPMYRPFDDTTMGFCHEGPHDLVRARTWLIDEDGSHMRAIKNQGTKEACMHEFWVPDGSALFYVSYLQGEQQRFIWRADPVTLENTMVMAMPPCSHLMSNRDGTLLVGDGAGHLEDIADKEAHAFEPDPFIHLFDLKTKQSRQVCAHNTSWKEYKKNHQISHPHPSFLPDESRIIFGSDFEGIPAIYFADI